GEVEKLEEFYRHGARMMTLCWNFDNVLATPALPIAGEEEEEPSSFAPNPGLPGLKEAGFRIVEAMEALGMIPDVSHLSDAGFYDVCKICRKPFVASHSNARAISCHARNLSDDMLRQLGEHGGVAGLNYYPEFIMEPSDFAATLKGESEYESSQTNTMEQTAPVKDANEQTVSSATPEEEATREKLLSLLAKHARHMANCGGVECVGLGSDFDGFGGISAPSDAAHVGDLAWALHRSGFSDKEVDGILYKNVLRVYREVLR
ncbi:MAG: membrane dipeptidase, partial [Lachnospiraceae bacterium]|nr:membrane dipeptidase [Lachnospiraceae bacterium]